jgi:hypothetical protein
MPVIITSHLQTKILVPSQSNPRHNEVSALQTESNLNNEMINYVITCSQKCHTLNMTRKTQIWQQYSKLPLHVFNPAVLRTDLLIHSTVSYDRSTASSKMSSPQSVI